MWNPPFVDDISISMPSCRSGVAACHGADDTGELSELSVAQVVNSIAYFFTHFNKSAEKLGGKAIRVWGRTFEEANMVIEPVKMVMSSVKTVIESVKNMISPGIMVISPADVKVLRIKHLGPFAPEF
jgi:hypothetical protein